MHYLIPLKTAGQKAAQTMGGKAAMLARLQQEGFQVPTGYCLPVHVYHEFLHETGLEAFITMELQRKDFEQMRWEEVWDVSLRIRNHFATRHWPGPMKEKLLEDLRQEAAGWPAVAVRSTAPGEDSARQSFAGLHESRVMLRGEEAILEAIRIVWASLWSDGALLYRHELGLDPVKSGMAVVVQEMVVGEVSGVLFTRAPQDRNEMMVEAVWGLNQALVDGTIEPDRWHISRTSGEITEKHEVEHRAAMLVTTRGLEVCAVDKSQSPLNADLCRDLYRTGCELESLLGGAVDIEWTRSAQGLHILQARPITATLQSGPDDERPWYLSLHRSLENLEALREELENDILPGMELDARQMTTVELSRLSNHDLAEEYARRSQILQKWLQTYKDKCIPMAHGLRLFGELYNDLFKPEDPFEFVSLLHSDDLLAVQRNRQLHAMANLLRADPPLLQQLKEGGGIPQDSRLQSMRLEFDARFSGINWVLQDHFDLPAWLVKLAEQDAEETLAGEPPGSKPQPSFDDLPDQERIVAERILAVARASYLLRDNDNLYLGKVRAGVAAAEQEVRKRRGAGDTEELGDLLSEETGTEILFKRYDASQAPGGTTAISQLARQLVGQPAGPGVSSGTARVMNNPDALAGFKRGEVLVCDAIEPNMTFLAPLAAAIIERRGGMLIHGAIIAREYRIPCVTGIPNATSIIQSGDSLTVDGYLGIVTIDRKER